MRRIDPNEWSYDLWGEMTSFSALVEPMLRGFQEMYKDVISQEMTDLSTGIDNELTSIAYAIHAG